MASTTHNMPSEDPAQVQAPQLILLDFFFPGFSVLTGVIQKYLHIDLNLYIPALLMLGAGALSWRYFSEYFWDQLEQHFMSHVDCPTNDETYNFLMNWVACQSFAKRARRFMVNTNLNSRSWFVWNWDDDEDSDGEEEEVDETKAKKKALQYTPTFGSHYFWYKGRLLIFRRTQQQNRTGGYISASDKEEISVSCFGRNPWVLKQLLIEARDQYMKKDESKTLIYRGTTRSGSTDPMWQRCMARSSRPLSTVILSAKVKQDLINDVTDYLDPATRRWYSNRGIPYRRGYLLYGPPGTGKSSLSLALAGFFKMRIYIVSLNSITANEESLASLFAELPRRCVVLLEDIDTAGLTHTRAVDGAQTPAAGDTSANNDMVPGQITPGSAGGTNNNGPNGRLSLSGLLNILDGVASQEGRVLIMTTNHREKLDKALLRPGRVDMSVKFDLADQEMTRAIFHAIFLPLEGDGASTTAKAVKAGQALVPLSEADEAKAAEEAKLKQAEALARVDRLADAFAAKIPAHEFSPAELQGYLLKHKRDAEGAVERADQWVVDTRKEKHEKQLREAAEKRKAEEEAKKKKEEEDKKKADEEKKEAKKQKREKSRKRKSRKSKKASDSESSSESESESEVEDKKEKKKEKRGLVREESKPKEAEEKADSKADATPEPLSLSTDTIQPPTVVITVADVVDGLEKRPADEGKHDSGYGTP